MAGQNARVLTKDLDSRLRAVEEKLSEIVEQLSRLAHPAQDNSAPAITPNGGGDHVEASDGGRLADLEAQVSRIDARMEKIASTLVEQASRWT